MASTSAKNSEKDSIAKERCSVLLSLAVGKLEAGDAAMARRYVTLARKLAMRHRFSLGSKSFCRECGVPWVAGRTVKVRTVARESSVAYTCLECGAVRRFGYSREKAAKAAVGK